MAKKLAYYQKDIVKALTEAGKWNDSLLWPAKNLAIALRTVEVCAKEIEGLTSTVVEEITRNGTAVKPHPVFKTLREAQETAARLMKILGMTGQEIEAVNDDPFKGGILEGFTLEED